MPVQLLMPSLKYPLTLCGREPTCARARVLNEGVSTFPANPRVTRLVWDLLRHRRT
jgi:hypothetical protein